MRESMRLLLAEPNPARQKQAVDCLSSIPGLSVSSVCADLTSAFDEAEHRTPDIALIAAELTRKPEFETMEMLFRMLSMKWMQIAWNNRTVGRSSLQTGGGSPLIVDLSRPASEISNQLRGRAQKAAPAFPASTAGLLRAPPSHTTKDLVLIGSSTGGVDALLRILGSFPKDCPPTLIVQHTGSSFSAGLARLLDRNIAPQVKEATDGATVSPGTVLLAPGSESHMVIEGRHNLVCKLRPQDPVSGHRPSVDVLFKSAVPVAQRVTAALLTGMGKDGGAGLLDLRKAGAHTIGQDKETSVVFGMPRYAAEIGAVCKTLPLGAIGPALLRPRKALSA